MLAVGIGGYPATSYRREMNAIFEILGNKKHQLQLQGYCIIAAAIINSLHAL